MVTKIVTMTLLPTVCILSFSVSCAHRDPIAQVKIVPSVEVSFRKPMKPDCRTPKQSVPADGVIHNWGTLTYPGYSIQTRYSARPPAGMPLQSVESSYLVVRHKKKVVAKFDAGIDSPLGNRTGGGWFPLLNNGTDQLVVSQDISRTGAQWVADFSKGFKVIFNGPKFQVGREPGDMTMSDLDDDGTAEITVPITAFYGFEQSRFTTMETPLPEIIFKYDPARNEYLPANPIFKACLLKDIKAAESNLHALNEQVGLGRLLSVVLDYVFVGEERRGWQLFEEICKLPDKSKIRRDAEKTVSKHPVYRYLQEPPAVERGRTAFGNLRFGRRYLNGVSKTGLG